MSPSSRQAGRTASVSAELLQAAFLASPTPHAIVETTDGCPLVAFNDAFCEALRRPRDELACAGLAELVASSDAAVFEDAVARARAGPSAAEPLAVRCRCGAGEAAVIHARLTGCASGGRAAGHALVVLERSDGDDGPECDRGAHPEVADSRKLLQDIIDGVPALVFIKDLDGRYMLANRHARAHYKGVMGSTDPDFAGREEAQQFRQHDAAALAAGRPLEFQEWSLHDGELHMYYSLKFPLLNTDGEAYALCGVATDITALKRAETASREARAEAERANRAKSRFLSRVSHELRTPLHSILGYTELLESQELPAKASKAVARMSSAGVHLLALIEDLLDMSSIETGADRISIVPVHASEPVVKAADIMTPLANAQGIELAVDLHGGINEFVAGDARRLVQVLVNLISNGVHYNRPGGEVRVSFRQTGDTLRVLVADTGSGIRARDRARIFLPFERFDREGLHPAGAGLGLAVSKTLIEAMGGRVGVESAAVGRGTTIFVELNRVDAPSNAREIVFGSRAPAIEDELPLHGTILYVDDHAANVELVEEALIAAGDVTLLHAGHGRLGISMAVELAPDLILLDLNLPDVPGEKVLAELKADGRTRDIPVLVMSADASPRKQRRVLAEGAAGYVTKPVRLAQLVELARASLAGRPQGATSP
ncbi:MAG: two-component system sensor protein [Conexibacter sp.]|nr:two-component system sensor protein [Conexibacter sp.]